VNPFTSTPLLVLSPGQQTTFNIQCKPGDLICLGGRPSGGGSYWGVDVDASKGCATCCYHCGNFSVANQLTCN
jgi:hypothetical protein